MTVSVIMPLYNKAAWVQRALDSLCLQTYDDFEVRVVDDGSTDGGGRLVRAYPDPRVEVVHQQNAGPGAARNAGAAQARGELLAFLDADDEWGPTFLQDAVRELDADPAAAAVTFGHRVVPGDAARQRAWRRRRLPFGAFRCGPHTSANQLLHVLAFVSPCATVIRREAFWRHGGFFADDRCTYGEDAWLFLRLLLSERVLLLPEQRVTFHLDASGLSQNHRGARPVEPFLTDPDRLAQGVPPALLPVLHELLSIRASKTACMLAFWGRSLEAQALLERFAPWRHASQPWSLRAALAASPLGALAAAAARSVPAARNIVSRRKDAPVALPALELGEESGMVMADLLGGLPAAEETAPTGPTPAVSGSPGEGAPKEISPRGPPVG